MNSLQSTLAYVIQSVVDLYVIVILLRIVMQFFGVNYYNQIAQLVTTLTNPLILPLRRVVPRTPLIDSATVVLLLSVQCLKFIMVSVVVSGSFPHLGALGLWVLGDSIQALINVFFYAILLTVVVGLMMSFSNPMMHNPLLDALTQITEPLMRPVRRIIPPVAGFDFSPLPVMLGLKVAGFLIAMPILQLGSQMAGAAY